MWLKDFYDFKRDNNPADAQQVVLQVENKLEDL